MKVCVVLETSVQLVVQQVCSKSNYGARSLTIIRRRILKHLLSLHVHFSRLLIMLTN